MIVTFPRADLIEPDINLKECKVDWGIDSSLISCFISNTVFTRTLKVKIKTAMLSCD